MTQVFLIKTSKLVDIYGIDKSTAFFVNVSISLKLFMLMCDNS